MSLLTDKMKGRKQQAVATEPLWRGPASAHEYGGVTQSLLSRYLCCPERFRITTIEGLRPVEKFNHRIEYGNLWHCAEEWYAKVCEDGNDGAVDVALSKLADYASKLCQKYPLDQVQVHHWYDVCRVTFPEYVRFWAAHPDVKARTPLMQEQVFDVPLPLPSGRTVRLRGKFDAVDLIGVGDNEGVWLFETKTKGDVDEVQLQRQMTFDLQTMLYLTALEYVPCADLGTESPIKGVRYNVVRRPLSGGKGSIVRRKGKAPQKLKSGKWGKGKAEESHEAYYARLQGIIAKEPQTYFHRWNVVLGRNDLDRFRREFLDPVLENLLDDYEWWHWCYTQSGGTEGSSVWDYLHRHKRFPHHQARHYRFPHGVNNPLLEGYSTDLDNYLETGQTTGLHRATIMFQELQ